MSLRLETLGGLRVLLHGVEQPALTRQYLRCGLLVFLAVERRAPRERVLSLLWPDRAPDKGRHALSQMLYELRQRLDGDWVTLEGEYVTIAPDVTCDALEYRDAVTTGMEDTNRLYRGPFLQSTRLVNTTDYEAWVDGRRAEFRELFRNAQHDHGTRLISVGDLHGALSITRRWALAEPFDEEAQRRLFTLLARCGLRNEALRQYEEYRLRLRELNTEPLASLVELIDAIRTGRLTHDPSGHGLPPSAPQLGAAAGVVVLPFQDMSPDGSFGYFCDGLAEEIISTLSGVRGLRVIPRTSAFAFRDARIRDAAGALGVTHAVEGSARFAAESYRVTVRLIDAQTEEELWQDRMEGDISPDVFATQDRIAESVSDALGGYIRLGQPPPAGQRAPAPRRPRPRPTNTEAYQLYLKGRQAWFLRAPSRLWEALDLFREAAALDPEYAPAYSGIADVYCLLGAFDYASLAPDEAYPRAREAADRALELDPDLATAHATLGNILVSYEWKWAEAESAYWKAIELDTGYSMARQWLSTLLLYQGKEDEALDQAILALELDPRSAHVSSHLARVYQLLRQPERCIEQYRQALTIDGGFVTAHLGLAVAEMGLGRTDAALARLEPLVEAVGDELTLVKALWGYALGVADRPDEARSVCQHLKATPARYLPPEHVGVAYLGLGETDRAVDWLGRSLEARSQVTTLLELEPLLDPLRSDPGFRKLLADVQAARSV
jgi:serine/threonine-protein kinase